MMLAGIDSGGTSCRVVVCDGQGRVLQKCTVPGHNPNADGFDALEESLRQGLTQALEGLGGLDCPLEALHMGAAGGEGENKSRLEAILRGLLPAARRVAVSSDGLIALSAGLGRKDGGVLIAGTGTVGFLRKGDSLLRFGGWGYLVDKSGSGWALGRDGFLAAMAENDAGLPATALTGLYESALGMTMAQAVPALYRGDVSLSACAPLVFQAAQAGDGPALEILRENAAGLARTLESMSRVFGGTCPVVLAGGLLGETSPYLAILRERTAEMPVRLIHAALPPVYGAAALAAALAGLPEDPEFESNFAETFEQPAENIEKNNCAQ